MTRGQVLFQPNSDILLPPDRRLFPRRMRNAAARPICRRSDVSRRQAGRSPPAHRRSNGIDTRPGCDHHQTIRTGGKCRSRRAGAMAADVRDWGVSGEGVYDFGWAELTSITAYRYNKYSRGAGCRLQQSRHPLSRRRRRFLQPLQDLQPGASAPGQRLRQPSRLARRRLLREREAAGRDNLGYGADYERYANCLVAANFACLTGQCSVTRAGFGDLLQPDRLRSAPAARGSRRHAPALAAFAGVPNIIPARRACVNFGAPPFGNSGFTNVATLLGHPGLSLDQRPASTTSIIRQQQLGAVHAQHHLDHRPAEADDRRPLHARAQDTQRGPHRQNGLLLHPRFGVTVAALQQPAVRHPERSRQAASESTTSGPRTSSRAPRCSATRRRPSC